MPIFGALAGLTAAGLYAAVDEIRVAHKIHSHQLSGSLVALMDYKVNDARFDGIIRRFENDWQLDGGTLYPAELVGFFAENPKARQQWIRMQASILLHDAMERRSCENDTKVFGHEAAEYERLYGDAEREYICQHSDKARRAVEQYEQEYRDHIDTLVRDDENYKRLSILSIIIGVLILVVAAIVAIANPLHPIQSVAVGALPIAIGLCAFGCLRMMYKKGALMIAILTSVLGFIYVFACA